MIEVCLVIACVLLIVASVYLNSVNETCSITITGESVRIIGCVQSPEFLDLIGKLKPAGSC
ncbi:triple gene block protein 3 [Ligustrum virus A]|uniref:Movement protein TGBp3 n=1 Tax=Ligustrum virus A TaxID=1899566 RepID=A0A1C9IAX3_9VIRU|nr:triple gene block protein 3 [Ligustrum virus A]AOO96602.1 triple gene block protein 3 [Ligustrum virus A]